VETAKKLSTINIPKNNLDLLNLLIYRTKNKKATRESGCIAIAQVLRTLKRNLIFTLSNFILVRNAS